MTTDAGLPRRDYASIRAALLERREIALLDVREEDEHAQAHPLFAANLPLARLELDAYDKLPRRDAPIVTFDAGDDSDEAERAARKLIALGFSNVAVFDGGPKAWRDAGGEIFRDVNSPSKAFGEWVEHFRATPSLSAEQVKALLDEGADVVGLDARRYDEYHTMSLPRATSMPGAELALRAEKLAPRPETTIIVNCAGRTRSIIGAQSLIDAGVKNPVFALRNGTIGWTLAGFALDHGASKNFPAVSPVDAESAIARARALSAANGVRDVTLDDIAGLRAQIRRTSYFFDVRDPAEYDAGHLPGFRNAPGGQLVQETDMFAPIRGARAVLFDDFYARADMTATWLARMGWEVFVLRDVAAKTLTATGPWRPSLPEQPTPDKISPTDLAGRLERHEAIVVDFTTRARHVQGHVPGAFWALRSRLAAAVAALPPAPLYVLTCGSSLLATFVAPEFSALTETPVVVLEGGTAAWAAQGFSLETGAARALSPPIDRYRRPYEGTDNPRAAMQAYLDWEFGLVAQLERDGAHFFRAQ